MTDFGSGTRKWTRLVARLAAALVCALLIITALTVLWIRSNQSLTRAHEATARARVATTQARAAAAEAARAVTCINNVLGARNKPTNEETDALANFATAFVAALNKKLTPAQARRAVLDFHAALDRVQRERARHPFGHC